MSATEKQTSKQEWNTVWWARHVGLRARRFQLKFDLKKSI